jgi:hypothetical protein
MFREREPLDEASRSLVAHIESVGTGFGRGQVVRRSAASTA